MESDWWDREMGSATEAVLPEPDQPPLNESFDFDQVLQGTRDSARSLTSARCGVMTLPDDELHQQASPYDVRPHLTIANVPRR